MISVSFAICCLVFLSIISVVYFSKKRINNMDNKIFSVLIILNLIGICIDVSGYFFFKLLGVDFILNVFISKIYLIYYIAFIFCLTTYVYNISFKNLNKIFKYFATLFAILCLIIFLLPINVTMKENAAFSYGPSVNLGYVCVFGLTFAMIVILLINIKKIKSKKYMPIFAFVILTFLAFAVQKINPEIALLLLSNSVVTTLMYFTIENPDVKLINELNENRILIEKTNEEKSNFLFKLTGEIKNPVNYIYHVSNDLLEEEDVAKLQKGAGVINLSAKRLSYIINDITDVSNMGTKNIKVINSNYNIYNMIDEIKVRLNKEKKDNVELRYNIDNNLPKALYGDVIKLKQVIMTFLSNSLKYTKKGFIEFNIYSIIKYDICRLIITIEDSGIGMDIAKVNDLLRTDEEISDEDLSKLGTIDLDIKLAKKVIKYLGGSIMIKSEEDKGTEIIITLDQKIRDVEKSNTSIKYENASFRNKRVLVVNDNIEELNIIEDIFKEQKVNVTTTMYGKDCIDKINSKEKFDLIIVDDEMPNFSGLDTLNELKKIKGFNTPVVIILSKVKEGIKHHYIEDGFKDYLLKENIKSETSRIAKKFI